MKTIPGKKSFVKKLFATIFVVAVATPLHAGDMQHDDHMMGTHHYGKVMLDKFEAGDNGTQRWDAQAWYGGDLDKLWIKTEGERSDGSTESAEAQALYSRAISPFFDMQIGVRHDFQPQPARDWFALGMQGLAPYFFETEATLFVGDSGRSALRLKASYDVLFTQRLILQPEIEANFYGKSDAATGVGSGLSDLECGLRLRYEIVRELAPYIGVVWTHQYGDTATFTRTEGTRAGGGDASDLQWVAGLKIWF